jgi:uncharacterized protein (TIGR00255 family)
MTGYAKCDFENDEYKIVVEVKSLNNKALNLKTRVPYYLNFLETDIRKVSSKYIDRGSIDLKIDFEKKDKSENFLIYDKKFALNYMDVLSQVETDFNTQIENKVSYLLNQNSLIKKDEIKFDEDEYRKMVTNSLEIALIDLNKMRRSEGDNLKEYFYKCLDIISEKLLFVKSKKDEIPLLYKEKMLKRLNEMAENINYREEDILKEIIIFTDKSDISEEISRLDSHLKYFREVISSDEKNIGKKLDFILQEIFRELNTASVKSNCYEMSKHIVEAKTEVEKIREQVQNIE